jgi:hypothetical protein
MKLRIGGLIVGIVFAIIDILLLVYLPSVANQYIKNFGADVDGTLTTVFLSPVAIALAIALAVLVIPSRAIKDAPKVTGGAKLLQGIVLALYYYVILSGGTVSLSVLYSDLDLVITVTLLITLALLEVSAVLRMLQGVLEMREHPAPAPTPAMPTTPPAMMPQK